MIYWAGLWLGSSTIEDFYWRSKAAQYQLDSDSSCKMNGIIPLPPAWPNFCDVNEVLGTGTTTFDVNMFMKVKKAVKRAGSKQMHAIEHWRGNEKWFGDIEGAPRAYRTHLRWISSNRITEVTHLLCANTSLLLKEIQQWVWVTKSIQTSCSAVVDTSEILDTPIRS